MYPGPWRTLPGVQFVDWASHVDAASIPELAAAVAHRNCCGRECVLIGSSLGGIVATEMTRLISVPHLFLVGTAVQPDEIGMLLRWLAPLAHLTPFQLAQRLAASLPVELFQMFGDTDPEFLRRMCRAIGEWKGGPVAAGKIHRVHGRHDPVIPPPADVDLLLAAGHLVAMTHADDCVAFVRERLGLLAA